MAVEVKWSDESKKTFEDNIGYLLEEWSEKEVRSFVHQTEYVIPVCSNILNPTILLSRIRRSEGLVSTNTLRFITGTTPAARRSSCSVFGIPGKTLIA